MNRIIHSPAGMRDILGTEYERKMELCARIREIFTLYGYRFIQTPALEFLDVFEKDKRTGSSSSFYKLFDRDGHTLALRPDFTPSVARAVSMYYTDEDMPLRLCYKGNVYVNYSNYRGRLNETTEMGVELLNEDSPAADAEVIAMAVEIMKRAGLSDFRISIGNAAYFKALAQAAGLDEETLDALRLLLTQRNQFGAQELVEKQEIDPAFKTAFMEFFTLFGDVEVLDRARSAAGIAGANEALERLKEVYRLLELYGCEKYVSFDLGMLSNYSYYTGIIFQALTYGTGDAVIKGGRYDNFVEKFGKNSPAVGFTARADEILTALMRQKKADLEGTVRTMVIYSEKNTQAAAEEIIRLRNRGRSAAGMPFNERFTKEEHAAHCERHCYQNIIWML